MYNLNCRLLTYVITEIPVITLLVWIRFKFTLLLNQSCLEWLVKRNYRFTLCTVVLHTSYARFYMHDPASSLYFIRVYNRAKLQFCVRSHRATLSLSIITYLTIFTTSSGKQRAQNSNSFSYSQPQHDSSFPQWRVSTIGRGFVGPRKAVGWAEDMDAALPERDQPTDMEGWDEMSGERVGAGLNK